eukprot:5377440-Prymnesium_polylepis.1
MSAESRIRTTARSESRREPRDGAPVARSTPACRPSRCQPRVHAPGQQPATPCLLKRCPRPLRLGKLPIARALQLLMVVRREQLERRVQLGVVELRRRAVLCRRRWSHGGRRWRHGCGKPRICRPSTRRKTPYPSLGGPHSFAAHA